MKLNLAIVIWAAIIPFGYSKLIFSTPSNNIYGPCNIAANYIPDASCFNHLASACDPSISGNGAKCEVAVNKFFDYFPLTSPWRLYGDNCMPGRVSPTGINVTRKFSAACISSIDNLIQNGKLNGINLDLTLAYCISHVWSLYGPLASIAPARLWPPISDPKYLSVGTAPVLSKRAFVFSIQDSGFRFDCNKDAYSNPMQDCINSIANFCYTDEKICKSVVDYHAAHFNSNWQNYFNSCASWKNNNNILQGNSAKCNEATTKFLQSVKTINAIEDNKEVSKEVDLKFTESFKLGLWTNQTILGAAQEAFLPWLSKRGGSTR